MSTPTRDGRRRRKAGEFNARREQLRRRQERHNRILAAAKAALTDDDTWVTVEGLRLLLTHDPGLALTHGSYTHLAIVRTVRFGLCVGEVCEKDKGHVVLRGSGQTIGLRRDQTVVFVRAVERGGERLPWLPSEDPRTDPNERHSR